MVRDGEIGLQGVEIVDIVKWTIRRSAHRTCRILRAGVTADTASNSCGGEVRLESIGTGQGGSDI